MKCRICGNDMIFLNIERQFNKNDINIYKCINCEAIFIDKTKEQGSIANMSLDRYPGYILSDKLGWAPSISARNIKSVKYGVDRLGKNSYDSKHVVIMGYGLNNADIKLERSDFNLTYMDYDKHELPKRADYASIVVGNEIIQHFIDPIEEFIKIKTILKTGGCFVGSTALIDYIDKRTLINDWFYISKESIDSGTCSIYTKKSIDIICSILGFENLSKDNPDTDFLSDNSLLESQTLICLKKL
jgi:hypothetical protein